MTTSANAPRQSRGPDSSPASAPDPIPNRNDALLTREQVGVALRAAGFPVASKTLATMATRGGGPSYRRFGARVLYRWDETLAWAEARLSGPVHSTSE